MLSQRAHSGLHDKAFLIYPNYLSSLKDILTPYAPPSRLTPSRMLHRVCRHLKNFTPVHPPPPALPPKAALAVLRGRNTSLLRKPLKLLISLLCQGNMRDEAVYLVISPEFKCEQLELTLSSVWTEELHRVLQEKARFFYCDGRELEVTTAVVFYEKGIKLPTARKKTNDG